MGLGLYDDCLDNRVECVILAPTKARVHTDREEAEVYRRMVERNPKRKKIRYTRSLGLTQTARDAEEP